MYKKKTVSLVLSAYNEQESVGDVVKGFKKLKIFDEIIVVDNNSKDKTSERAKTSGAKVVIQKKQGYGHAIIKGLATAKGDIIITCDADNTYTPSDAKSLLVQSDEYDFVFGTRTFKAKILKGATMGLARRVGNIVLSAMITILFNGPFLSDAGCTFRLLNRKPYDKIKRFLKTGGINFQPELTILALLQDFKVKEVPVTYRRRSGKSKISGSTLGGLKTAKAMLLLILNYRWKTGTTN